MSAPFAVGDTVRVTFEGKVERINKIPGDESAVELKIFPANGDFVQYVDTKNVHSIEKIEPPVEVFGPGTVVRGRFTRATFTLGIEGYLRHRDGSWVDYILDDGNFTSDVFERVSVG